MSNVKCQKIGVLPTPLSHSLSSFAAVGLIMIYFLKRKPRKQQQDDKTDPPSRFTLEQRRALPALAQVQYC